MVRIQSAGGYFQVVNRGIFSYCEICLLSIGVVNRILYRNFGRTAGRKITAVIRLPVRYFLPSDGFLAVSGNSKPAAEFKISDGRCS